MRRTRFVMDLNNCTEFRQTLQAKPPMIVHGTLILLGAVLTFALLWSALTEADLVVRSDGKVRPMLRHDRLADSVGEEIKVCADFSGQILEMHVQEGDEVKTGDLLARFDGETLDNQIAKYERMIQTGENELAKMTQLEELLVQQYEAAEAKAKAELAQATGEINRAEKRRALDIRIAKVALENATDRSERFRKMAKGRVVTEVALRDVIANRRRFP